ncbi:MAG: hypothetical protein Q7U10_00080 [Thermodesulfovibrionia bacterium]|nr:hypothetical protein [Thermodesulfovibrionia bacterium]
MKTLKVVLLFIAVYGLVLSFAHAAGDVSKGDVNKGKALFNDPKFAGAVSGKSCNSCHPDGRGLGNAGTKTEFKVMGKNQKSLEDVVNSCIEAANKGKALDLSSEQMKDIVAYIKSL